MQSNAETSTYKNDSNSKGAVTYVILWMQKPYYGNKREGALLSKECLVRENIRKCGDSLTRKNGGKSFYRRIKNTT